MAYIDWSQDLSVNFQKFDEQHKVMAGLVNDLYDAMITGKNSDFMGKILKELLDYTAFHFKTEEEYMYQYSYPQSLDHKARHKDLVDNLTKLNKEFNSKKVVISNQTMSFLKDWLNYHILKIDIKLGNFLRDKRAV